MRPFVLLNMSMTADGKIASANRRVSSFGSPLDQNHLYALRGGVDAILCGARTVDLNRVSLGAGTHRHVARRIAQGLRPHPIRVIASGRATLNPDSHLFTKSLGPVVLLTTRRASKRHLEALRSKVDEVFASGESEIDFNAAFAWLHDRWKVRRLLCEGGGHLNEALFRGGLVDEMHLTLCPLILGGRSAPTLADGIGLGGLQRLARFKVSRRKQAGGELFLVLHPASAPRVPQTDAIPIS